MSGLLRVAGPGLIALLVFVSVGAGLTPPDAAPDAAPEEMGFADASLRPQYAALPTTAPEAGRSLLDRSPFAQDRSAFNREASIVPPPPPVEVRLTGVSRMGGSLRANLMIEGQSLAVKQGDDTPAGKILKVEAGAVVLEGPPERRIEMFRQ